MAGKDNRIKKVGAASILSTITLGGLWQIYQAIDLRVRANEINVNSLKVEVREKVIRIDENVKDIKYDVRYIKNKLEK